LHRRSVGQPPKKLVTPVLTKALSAQKSAVAAVERGGVDFERFDHKRLFEFSKKCLMKVGVAEPDSAITADHLVTANLRGVDSHGVVRLPYYIEGVEMGIVKPRLEVRVLRDGDSWALLDCGHGLGIPAAMKASEAAVIKASTSGVAVVGAVNLGHVGMLAYYTQAMAAKGLVSIAMANGVAEMPPWGGIGKVFGTNPISMGVPRRGSSPIIVDMATSAMAKFKVLLAAAQGKLLPEGVAVDSEGRPTRDPSEALKGFLLPFGGYKGYALALFVELMSAALIGGPRSVEVRAHASQQGGLVVAAINPDVFVGREKFLDGVERVVEAVKSVRRAEGVGEVLLPGEPEEREASRRLTGGIPLDWRTAERLRMLADRLGVHFPEPLP